MGLTGGFLDGVPPEGVREALERARAAVQRECPQVRVTPKELPRANLITHLETSDRWCPHCVSFVANSMSRACAQLA